MAWTGNLASGAYATVTGGGTSPGGANVASDLWSAVNDGQDNTASHDYATISGGCAQTSSTTCEHLP